MTNWTDEFRLFKNVYKSDFPINKAIVYDTIDSDNTFNFTYNIIVHFFKKFTHRI